MNKTFKVLFHILKSRINSSTGEAPIFMRITIDGQRAEISTNTYILPTKWDSNLNKVIGTTESAKSINSLLDSLKFKATESYRLLLERKGSFSASELKDFMLGKDTKSKMLLEIFEQHNRRVKLMIGEEFAIGTYKKYVTTLEHLKSFIKDTFKKEDLPLNQIDNYFVQELDYYLRSNKKHSNNSAVKYMRNIRKIINQALQNGWITKDPFSFYKGRLKQVSKPYLTKAELDIITNKVIPHPRLDKVRDVFVFCCYTGLAFIDVYSLNSSHITMGIDGDEWIVIQRTKTNIEARIPLLPIAKLILEKYKFDLECNGKNKLLPVPSNQKMNAYLKEIAAICGIEKELTTHCARRTMGTTIGLSNGLPMESIAKILGHSNTRITESIYAKLTDNKLASDVSELKKKLI